MQAVHDHNAQLLPIDSEHNALFQCMPANFKTGQQPNGVQKITLTASGGAFRNLPLHQLADVTPKQACTHPNWNMGQKVTVDSATMMNKGLEVIEAHWLFGLPIDQIQTLLHPQSIIHSLVEYQDGSVLAQLGNPDMRTPIAHALAWPDRIDSGVEKLDLLVQNRLDFIPMDRERYPCLDLAYQALKIGGTAPVVLNAANEVAVQAFLQSLVRFTDIYSVNAQVLEQLLGQKVTSLEMIQEEDFRARECARNCIMALTPLMV
jgi:1-deoxy-D-xylulose-5-phosphate reductoisomerase